MGRCIMRGGRHALQDSRCYKIVGMVVCANKISADPLAYLVYIVTDMRLPAGPSLGEFEQLVLFALLRLGNGAFGAAIHREIVSRATGARHRRRARSTSRSIGSRPSGWSARTSARRRAARRPPAQALSPRHRRPAGRASSRLTVSVHLDDDSRRASAGNESRSLNDAPGGSNAWGHGRPREQSEDGEINKTNA